MYAHIYIYIYIYMYTRIYIYTHLQIRKEAMIYPRVYPNVLASLAPDAEHVDDAAMLAASIWLRTMRRGKNGKGRKWHLPIVINNSN